MQATFKGEGGCGSYGTVMCTEVCLLRKCGKRKRTQSVLSHLVLKLLLHRRQLALVVDADFDVEITL